MAMAMVDLGFPKMQRQNGQQPLYNYLHVRAIPLETGSNFRNRTMQKRITLLLKVPNVPWIAGQKDFNASFIVFNLLPASAG